LLLLTVIFAIFAISTILSSTLKGRAPKAFVSKALSSRLVAAFLIFAVLQHFSNFSNARLKPTFAARLKTRNIAPKSFRAQTKRATADFQ